MTRVGMIGVGNMGGPIAARLSAAGVEVVACDPARPPSPGANGIQWVGSPREVAVDCDTILVIVADDEEVRHVVGGCDGIVGAAHSQTTVVVHSTIDPLTVEDLARWLAPTGSQLVDAGMSRGDGRMIDGSLTLFVGGNEEAVERIRPIMDHYSDNLVHVGPLGTGMALKLCNNLLLHGNRMLLLEVATLIEAAGVSRATLLTGIRSSTGGSWVATHWGSVDEAALGSGLGSTPMVRRTTRELALVREMATRTGTSTPVITDVVGRLPAVLAKGMCPDEMPDTGWA